MNTRYIFSIRVFSFLILLWSINLTNAIAQETYFISGKILTTTGHPMPNVVIELTGNQQTWWDTTTTDGYYLFDGIPENQSYTLSYTKEDDPLNGIDWRDMERISKHLLGVSPLNFNGQFAADVDNTHYISTFDLIGIQQLLFFGENNAAFDWTFLYAFREPQGWPGGTANNWNVGEYPIDLLQGNLENIDFVGIKRGDVDQSADPFE